uniref:Protein ABIL3 n=1 Tax=Salix viminalis TaxID=40686 RepID=A0A6N2K9E6_SALVM
MGTLTASSLSREASNYDEVSMQQSLLFSDSLKFANLFSFYQDLKNLRSQLYSAAEYFELSYTNDDQKQIVVETLKDYAIKALVNTVDHLGSVTYKVNDLLDEKVDEVSGTEFRVSCIEQRLRTCQEYIDHEGISQQSLVIDTPKYPKRYILPERRSISPHRFPLLRSGSVSSRPVSSRPTTPNTSRPTTPSSAPAKKRYPSEPRKSASMRLQAEKENSKDIEQYPSKSKRLLKALLSRRKSKKDEMLYTYLDEY